MSRIFISYRSLERSFAERIAEHLTLVGWQVWFDQQGGISPGQDWERMIEQAIDDPMTVAVIPILSPEYLLSNVCMRELRRADRVGKAILPLLLADIPSFPLSVQDLQYIDFRDQKLFAANMIKLLAGLQKLVGEREPKVTARQAPMKNIDQLKLKRLQQQMAQYEEEIGAVLTQLATIIDAEIQIRLERKINFLEEKIAKLKVEINALSGE